MAGARENPWIEVKSAHFRVLTDGSADDARRIAHEFEQIRTVLQLPFPTCGAAGAQAVQGTIKSTTCGDAAHPGTLTPENDGKALSFKGFGSYQAGFSDTLWYGAGHFSVCRHLDGLRAVVRYKASNDKQFAGDIASLEFREDLPQPFEAALGAAQTGQKPTD